MSSDQSAPESLSRDEWVQRHLGFTRQQQEVDEQLSRFIQATTPDPHEKLEDVEGERESRSLMLKELLLLKNSAMELASIAPPEQYLQVAEQIENIGGLIKNEKWRTAQDAIVKTNQLVDERMVTCKALRELQLRIADLTLRLDKVAPKLLKKDLDLLDEALNLLDRQLNADTLEKSRLGLEDLVRLVEEKNDEAKERLGRIKDLQIERDQAVVDTQLWITEAELLQAEVVAGEAKAQILALEKLQESQDITALEEALKTCTGLFQGWKKELAKIQHLRDVEQWREDLSELGEAMRKLQADNETLLESAVETLDEEVREATQELETALEQEPNAKSVVDAARLALDNLSSVYDTLGMDMSKITVLQGHFRSRLLKYKEIGPPVKGHKGRPDELDQAFTNLPEPIQDPEEDGWDKAEEWIQPADWEYWNFLSAWAKRMKSDVETQEGEYFDEMKARWPNVLKTYTQQRDKGSDDHRESGDELRGNIEDLLNDNKPKRLKKKEYDSIEGWFGEIVVLVDEIKKYFIDQRKRAVDLDIADGGHSVARHGPEVTEAALLKRLKSAIAPDGTFSPAEKSSRFVSFDVLLATREAAFAEAAAAVSQTEAFLFGADRDQAPDPNHHIASRRRGTHSVNMGHAFTVGQGFIGSGVATPVGDPSRGGQKFSDYTPLPPLKRTQSTLQWNAVKGFWVAAQHFPTDV